MECDTKDANHDGAQTGDAARSPYIVQRKGGDQYPGSNIDDIKAEGKQQKDNAGKRGKIKYCGIEREHGEEELRNHIGYWRLYGKDTLYDGQSWLYHEYLPLVRSFLRYCTGCIWCV